MVKKVANKLRASGQIQDKDRYIPISEAKEQMVAMLKEIYLEIEKLEKPHCHNASHADGCVSKWEVGGVIQQKINALRGE